MMQLEGFRAGHACQVAGVSRAGFYRHYQEHEPRQAEVALRDLIQQIALENRFYGYRRVARELEQRGVCVNHKRVLRLMRADNLLAVRQRRWVFTTDARHTYAVYPNLAARLTLSRINQLWVADITYIRLRETLVYLAVVLDAYSRRVVGWELSQDLRAELALGALNRALAERPIQPGIVHHSDRGVQYGSEAYVARLEAHGFLISMSRSGNPYDNARAESFLKTLKSEEVAMHRYRDVEDARASIRHFIEEVYNTRRLHSALGYVAPAAFERAGGRRAMSFFRHAEIYRSDVIPPMQEPRSDPGTAPRPHRLDEFPAGYSLAGCSPAEPASASPARTSMRYVWVADNDLSANGNLSLICVSQGKGAVHSSQSPSRDVCSSERGQAPPSTTCGRVVCSGLD